MDRRKSLGHRSACSPWFSLVCNEALLLTVERHEFSQDFENAVSLDNSDNSEMPVNPDREPVNHTAPALGNCDSDLESFPLYPVMGSCMKGLHRKSGLLALTWTHWKCLPQKATPKPGPDRWQQHELTHITSKNWNQVKVVTCDFLLLTTKALVLFCYVAA